MDGTFWAGAIIGAVFGLAADFWKRPFDRLLDRRLENRTSMRAEGLIRRLQQDRQGLRDFLVVQILETTLIGSLVSILSGLLFAAGSLIELDFSRLLIVLGQVVAIVGAAMIVRIAGDAVTVARQVARATGQPDVPEPPG
jgi:hypothetical protein